MRTVLAILLFLAAMGEGRAQDCASLMQGFRVPPPPAVAPTLRLEGEHYGTLFDCPPEVVAMFQANHAAIAAAEPPAELSDLHGTWLGDDVLLYLAGIALPGQEVLRIGPGPTPGTLRFEQLWYKAQTPDRPFMLWEQGRGYSGMVAEGVLEPDATPGTFRVNPADESAIRYGTARLEHSRGEDLWVRQRLNRFEGSVTPTLHGDVLVLRAEVIDPLARSVSMLTDTYARVADTAPDRAILLVAALEVSQAVFFDCLTHQLTDGEGPLIDALAPFSQDEVATTLEALLSLRLRRLELFGGAPNLAPAVVDTIRALTLEVLEMQRTPLMQHLAALDLSPPALGCAAVY